MRHVEIKEGLSNGMCGLVLAEKFSLFAGNNCMSVGVIMVYPFLSHIYMLYLKKGCQSQVFMPSFLIND